ncbi:ABC transporter permease [Amycolatopsis nigrescens]|uniref:ABC transporter permease n=1 Tax=Amycolatopsis nigrescens TaxID=381445 RepID=UPI000377F0FD|nr:ABC transporter permease [Amycolatopsis nigrescens]
MAGLNVRGYAAGRLGLGLVQLTLLTIGVFLLTELLPGDAADVSANENATPEQVAALRHELGLDRPAWERFFDWLGGLVTGDLGNSLSGRGPVTAIVADSAGATLVLAGVTLLLVVPLAVLLGVLAGTREGGRLDRVISSVTLGLHAVPDFVLALLLVTVLALKFGWFPATWVGGDLLTEPALLVLPVLVLLTRTLCTLTRQVRAGTVRTLRAEYVLQASRLGVPRRNLLLRHVFPNAAVPGIQELARVGDNLLGGILVVEAIFAIPGVATALVAAVTARDLPVVQGLTLVLAVAAVAFNLAADLLCDRLVPRTETLR